MDRVSFTTRMYNRYRHILFSGFGTSLGKVGIIIFSAALECAKKSTLWPLAKKGCAPLNYCMSYNDFSRDFIVMPHIVICGAWWPIGSVDAFCPKGRGSESRSSRNVAPSLTVACGASSCISYTVSVLCRERL